MVSSLKMRPVNTDLMALNSFLKNLFTFVMILSSSCTRVHRCDVKNRNRFPLDDAFRATSRSVSLALMMKRRAKLRSPTSRRKSFRNRSVAFIATSTACLLQNKEWPETITRCCVTDGSLTEGWSEVRRPNCKNLYWFRRSQVDERTHQVLNRESIFPRSLASEVPRCSRWHRLQHSHWLGSALHWFLVKYCHGNHSRLAGRYPNWLAARESEEKTEKWQATTLGDRRITQAFTIFVQPSLVHVAWLGAATAPIVSLNPMSSFTSVLPISTQFECE